jgi:hypothetical protein
MKRSALFAVALAAATLFLDPAPLRAFPTGPGDSLLVVAYYSDATKTQLVGQRWSGCGQPNGSWGTTTPYLNLFFPAC